MQKNHSISVITIDGPGGTGKGTISQMLAKKLGWHFLDSGALYRVLALAALKNHVDWQDETALTNLAKNLDVQFKEHHLGESSRVILMGEDVSVEIRSEKCGAGASQIAAFPKVRAALIERQRAFRKSPGLVTDGRDMGTVIFPDAHLKFYLIASQEERAKRRYNQLKQQGMNVSLPTVLQDLKERDARDQNRAIAPLKPAANAIVIDTTALSVEQVFQQVWGQVKQYQVE